MHFTSYHEPYLSVVPMLDNDISATKQTLQNAQVTQTIAPINSIKIKKIMEGTVFRKMKLSYPSGEPV
jgi:hypothetical protein